MELLTKREKEKLKTRAYIIQKAEQMFCEYGYDNTSMDDLAKESEYTKRTIYKYFESKEDLFFAVLLKAYQRLEQQVLMQIIGKKKGFEKLQVFYYTFKNIALEDGNIVKLMGMIAVANKKHTNIQVPNREQFYLFDEGLFEQLGDFIKEGQEDGSIRQDIEANKLLYSAVFTVSSFFILLGSTGDCYVENFKLDKQAWIEQSITLMLDGIKSQER